MKYFDTFDENGMFLSSEDEQDVHYKGLWHKVVRVWLYDDDGNIYLRKLKENGKLDCINEIHLYSSESMVSCFDRGMFEKLGIHFPSNSEFYQVSMKKVKIHKVYSDNSELKDYYFLCDCIGQIDDNISFMIFSTDTEGLVKVNAKGVLNMLSTRTGEVVASNVLPTNNDKEAKFILKADDIYENVNEDTYSKYSSVIKKIAEINDELEKEKLNEENKRRLEGKKKNSLDFDEEIISKADDNEGSDLY